MLNEKLGITVLLGLTLELAVELLTLTEVLEREVLVCVSFETPNPSNVRFPPLVNVIVRVWIPLSSMVKLLPIDVFIPVKLPFKDFVLLSTPSSIVYAATAQGSSMHGGFNSSTLIVVAESGHQLKLQGARGWFHVFVTDL